MLLPKLVEKLKRTVGSITAAELNANINRYTIIDVREDVETESGILPSAIHLSKGVLETKIESIVKDPNAEIVVYCAAGTRSLLAAESLKSLGYKNVLSLDLGIKGWKDAGLPLIARTQNQKEFARYAAQMRLKAVGENGQKLIGDSRVLVVGAGGLGSPTAYYLAAAGVGTIGIVDDDKVEISNLQRQILHNNDRIGLSKAKSAQLTLNALNPTINVITFEQRLSRSNVDQIISKYDFIVDGTDNFQTRYLVNDACLKHGKLNVHGSVFGFEGQAAVFCREDGPCYRCLYPAPPPTELSPNCNEAGVLGVLPGIVGLLQATEVLKLILKIGEPLSNKLLLFDALESDFKKLNIKKKSDCPYCRDASTRSAIQYQDYEQFCATGQ